MQEFYCLKKAVTISTQGLFHLSKRQTKKKQTNKNLNERNQHSTSHHDFTVSYINGEYQNSFVFTSFVHTSSKVLSEYLCTVVWHIYATHRTLLGFCVIKTPPLAESRREVQHYVPIGIPAFCNCKLQNYSQQSKEVTKFNMQGYEEGS